MPWNAAENIGSMDSPAQELEQVVDGETLIM